MKSRNITIIILTVFFSIVFMFMIEFVFNALEDLLKTKKPISEELSHSLSNLKWTLRILFVLLTAYLGCVISYYNKTVDHAKETLDNAGLAIPIVNKNDRLIQDASKAIISNSDFLQHNLKTYDKTNSILNDIPVIQNLLVSDKKLYKGKNMLGLISKPVRQPNISEKLYKTCIGAIDVIIPDTFLFQDLLLCQIYMKYLILRAEKITDEYFKHKIIVADRKDIYINDEVSPIFSMYIQVTIGLGYKNFIIDRNTFQRVIEKLGQRRKNNLYNKRILEIIKLQPSITIGLGERRSEENKGEKVQDFPMRCDYQDLKKQIPDIKTLEGENGEPIAKLIYSFYCGFINSGLCHLEAANESNIDLIFDNLEVNTSLILKEINNVNKEFSS